MRLEGKVKSPTVSQYTNVSLAEESFDRLKCCISSSISWTIMPIVPMVQWFIQCRSVVTVGHISLDPDMQQETCWLSSHISLDQNCRAGAFRVHELSRSPLCRERKCRVLPSLSCRMLRIIKPRIAEVSKDRTKPL